MKTTRFSCLSVLVLGTTLCAGPLIGQSMAEHAHAKAELSSSLTLEISGKTTKLSVAELQLLPQKTITVHNAHTKKDESYTGVELSDLLARYGLPLDKGMQKQILHSYLRAEGTDHYFVLYSAAEVESSLHEGDVLIATKMNGGGLEEDGALKLVASADKKPMRWVRNLTKITLVTVK
ncbi:MAG TPA: molybdopterin-dependent oxidoreductase [Edaphobacter sp.]|nr:molybdopterin-dependent oxidoreductase [Edaphobacter sp.]